MAFRKSRRLRRNLRKSRKNRNRYYRGGGAQEDAIALVQNNNTNDPGFGELALKQIKAKYDIKNINRLDDPNINSQHTMTTNVFSRIPRTNTVSRELLKRHADYLQNKL